ncbi:MAG: hypothetical protein ACRCVU_20285 [Flavobacterium sp.]
MKFVVELTEKQHEALVKRASVENGYEADDDFNPYDYSGGNFDDCYQLGMEHADADAAREILSILGNPIKE